MAEVALVALLYLLLLCYANGIIALTDGENAAALRALKSEWQNTPPNWNGPDPCGTNWEGVICTDSKVTSLSLSTMNLKGRLASDIGCLSDLRSLDLSYNKELTGPIPNSIGQLLHLDTFHFNKNHLVGQIPPEIFNEDMKLIHVLLDSNRLTGNIPETLGLVSTLEVLRLDRNSLEGSVPLLTSLTKINELHLSNNKLEGSLPDLFAMRHSLNYVDLSNNSFTYSVAPAWLAKLESLTTLVVENGGLEGQVPPDLFGLPQLQTVRLRHNSFNNTLKMDTEIGPQLQYVDFEYNEIQNVAVGENYNRILLLLGNPACEAGSFLSSNKICKPAPTDASYKTSLSKCGTKSCHGHDQKLNPATCACQVPLTGELIFRSPSFSDLSNASRFQQLEASIWRNLSLPAGYVFICCLRFDENNYLNMQLQIFPPDGKHFKRTDIQRIGFALSKQTYKPPHEFGPFFFIADTYIFPGEGNLNSLSLGAIVGIAVASALVILLIFGVTIYALKQKRRAEKALEFSKPFASWGASGGESGAPKLKGARWFSFQELKMASNNFSEANVIGSGGYGKVYKGILTALGGSEIVAIKRAQQGSMQGGTEFKNEIELLSRVHHKNLVGLIGFCFEQGEQMLVYEYMSNGTLRDSLSGRTGIYIDWRRRVRIALGSAKGLSYLHEHANPPIIHRDVKSTNILLDGNLTAKVADFGLSKLVADGGIDGGGKGHVSTQVKGTLGYLDPEYYMTQQLSEKSDVYSFGVVLMEILTARQPIERGKYIVREVKGALETEGMNGVKELLDPLLIQLRDLDADSYASLPGLESFVNVAVQCVEEAAADRPTMSEVVKELEAIVASDKVGYGHDNSSSSVASDAHPYAALLKKGGASRGGGSFDYSGGFSVPSTVEPK
ncbi:leucine-rich repeat receptor protein kinase HPCA1 isoform X3 [Cryptomeria japonica]|uniref:leucine-rich repeat receptor protein kinase HPCA1 isoform X3 n=1 Tax=Cryptomeria japonica TaxID=3369 RepID=UPI0027DAA02F|nr:leucine-rich repeat receptor protein kinase HPCA1 isoform X3 [Cryptomeria japonica]